MSIVYAYLGTIYYNTGLRNIWHNFTPVSNACNTSF